MSLTTEIAKAGKKYQADITNAEYAFKHIKGLESPLKKE